MPAKRPTARSAKGKKTSSRPVVRKTAARRVEPARGVRVSAQPHKAPAPARKAPAPPAAATPAAVLRRPPRAGVPPAPPAAGLPPRAASTTPSGAEADDIEALDPGSLLAGPRNVQPYIVKRGEQYMSKQQLLHFRYILNSWKRDLMVEVDRTVSHMKDEAANFPDPNDRATQEEEFSLELRTRDRERKLIRKIDEALKRIEGGSYGYCLETGEEPSVGRFAPSPTGALHLGSLVAALGSFLDARSRGGRWLVRMEDLDTPRVIRGCAGGILRTLDAFGLHWDGEVAYQSERTAHYARALEQLRALDLTFECSCSRSDRPSASAYPGTCRAGPKRAGPTATRFRVADRTLSFTDRVQGRLSFPLRERGDVIIRRRDGTFAYQLAVVVDDALQGVSDVVRGADLLDSTPWQIAVQEALALPPPRYAHLPLVTEPSGAKLAKSRRAVALDPAAAGAQLHEALGLLRQNPPVKLKLEPGATVLEWGCAHWDLDRVRGLKEVRAGAAGRS